MNLVFVVVLTLVIITLVALFYAAKYSDKIKESYINSIEEGKQIRMKSPKSRQKN